MENLIILTRCEDGSCCCLTQKTTVVFISIISLAYSFVDRYLASSERDVYCGVQEQVECMKKLLHTLFQMANVVSLVGTVTENALLLKIYLWYMLGFVVMALVVSIIDFILRLLVEGPRSLLAFLPEVALLFVVFRCLPLVDNYKRRIEMFA